ncbi:hypothetical protein ACWEN6_23920 [Sphaerisporangium sp. NPDC004334]
MTKLVQIVVGLAWVQTLAAACDVHHVEARVTVPLAVLVVVTVLLALGGVAPARPVSRLPPRWCGC